MLPTAAIAAAAYQQPVKVQRPAPPVVAGRVLLVDGDYLAYNGAGGDDTEPGDARRFCLNRISMMRELSGAETVCVHLTAPSSHKGYRYIIAKTKPYQAQRSGRRPKNWAYLREWLELYSGTAFRTKVWDQREADDGIAYHATVLGPDKAVIATRDKDMRMIPAWHINWETLDLIAAHGQYSLEGSDGLLYGHAWFWQQCLQGDTADNIPGLPRYVQNLKAKPVGEVTAKKLLEHCTNDAEAVSAVLAAYRTYYAESAEEKLAEQMILLWLRRDVQANVYDVKDWFSLPEELEAAIVANHAMVEAMRLQVEEIECVLQEPN